jgi:signal transduction histidine kinase
VRVTDDGKGGASLDAGSGISGLRDRVEALRGTLALLSPPGRGTTLTAVFPL